MTDNRAEYEKMLERYYFKDLYSFIKDSTGVAVTIAYIILILTSMAYLSVFYSHFDIEIIKLVTLEDILTTPIKNPNILIALVTIVGAMYIADVGNRYHARLNLKYFDKETPWHIKLMQYFTWIPRSEKGNKGFILALILIFISTYMYFFADIKARAAGRIGPVPQLWHPACGSFSPLLRSARPKFHAVFPCSAARIHGAIPGSRLPFHANHETAVVQTRQADT